jgi:hypothetical protein
LQGPAAPAVKQGFGSPLVARVESRTARRKQDPLVIAPDEVLAHLLVWGFPIAAIAVGLIVVALLLRRCTSRGRAAGAPSAPWTLP